ncbi:MAG: class I SAM-dependent methyltransferase [Gammaproteobacteria bacterium]
MSRFQLPADPLLAEQIKEHYEIERKLADRLRNSTKEERAGLYTSLYDELFRRVPYHPQLTNKENPSERLRAVRRSIRLFGKRLRSDSVFLEIGPGDCALSAEVASAADRVVAVDVSTEIPNKDLPSNVEFVVSDGSSIDMPEASVDIAYSNQLMEHLHPDDAEQQLTSIYRVLKSGGRYYCITPNRLTGPHDISSYFDSEATCFHLREYSNEELVELFRAAGFRKVLTYIGKQGIYIRVPLFLKIWTERLIVRIPRPIRRPLSNFFLTRLILRIVIVGEK